MPSASVTLMSKSFSAALLNKMTLYFLSMTTIASEIACINWVMVALLFLDIKTILHNKNFCYILSILWNQTSHQTNRKEKLFY